MSLRSSRSTANPRVSLITDTSTTTSTPVKRELPPSPTSLDHGCTSLRRTTRSTTKVTQVGNVTPKAEPTSPSIPLDLSSYAYPSTPRKKSKMEPITLTTPPNQSTSKTPATPKLTAKKPLPLLSLAKPHPEPARWREQYALIERMRSGISAPVDTMGCERPSTSIVTDPKSIRFHILISLMLSSQTKDAVTSQAVTNLHSTLPGGLTAESLATAPTETIQECIHKVGFWRRKTDYIVDAAKVLMDRPGEEKGDVPNTLEGLCNLRGVGPKMAFLCLQCAWDINAGIGVDVHVHRITNRLKWHKSPTTTPEQTRLNLQSWLPPNLHKSINPMMVGFGQVICLPVGPRCDVCLLGRKKLCPSRVGNVKAEGRKEVLYTFKTDDDEEGKDVAKVEVEYERDTKPTLSGMDIAEEKILEIIDRVDGTQGIGK